MGAGSEHELALSVGVVDLARQQGGQLVGPASGFIQEALAIPGAVATVRRSTNQQKKENNKNNNNKNPHMYTQKQYKEKQQKKTKSGDKKKEKKKKKGRISGR